MIHSVKANYDGFREVHFVAGANLVLADRSERSGERDTTNALGKSTLIDIIDFCLGSGVKPGKGLRAPILAGLAFTLELDVAGKVVKVTRTTGNPSQVFIVGPTEGWQFQPSLKSNGNITLDIKRWRGVLAQTMFGLSENDFEHGYHPSARSLLSYFTRSKSAAYISPFKYFDNQKTWDIQLHNAFLLGLDWEKASDWQQLKDQKNALTALRQAIKTGAIDGELESVGELEAERVRLSSQLSREAASLENFQVMPQYREIETQANLLTKEIHALVNANIAESRRLQRYQESFGQEGSPQSGRLEALYEEAGIALPGLVVKSLSDARAFNEKIVRNRREFIRGEVGALEHSIGERRLNIADLTSKRAEFLCALAGQGALEELTQLQTLHAATRLNVDGLTSRIAQIRQMTTRSDTIKVDIVNLKRAAEIAYEERRERWATPLGLFSQFSERLYKAAGRLVIDIDETGYKFDVEIAGSPSEGIGKMKIFCYDLTLICFARLQGLGIDFLVHDSTIFDGVDPRQRAHALELADEMAQLFGFQYICTLNTDMLPSSDFSPGFDVQDLVRLRLTDTDPSGSLMGFRY